MLTARLCSKWCLPLAIVVGLVLPASNALAGPFELRVDALGQALSPTGLLVLSGDGQVYGDWLSAEGTVWAGAGSDNEADVLTLFVRARDPEGRAEAQVGRFVLGLGALRPVHLDGAFVRLRLPASLVLESFSGVLVKPMDEKRSVLDWTAGVRVSRNLYGWGGLGFAYMQSRDAGFRVDHEVGADLGVAITKWVDFALRAAYELDGVPGFSEVQGSLLFHETDFRLEFFGQHRSPSRILPSNSLFAVLGDIPSQLLGLTTRERLTQHLEVRSQLALRRVDDFYGEALSLSALLRTSETLGSSWGLHLRRESTPAGDWTGVRVTGRYYLLSTLSISTELEAVMPDRPQGRGKVWPWMLAALSYEPAESWEVSAAAIASATPQYDRRVDALVRVSKTFGGP